MEQGLICMASPPRSSGRPPNAGQADRGAAVMSLAENSHGSPASNRAHKKEAPNKEHTSNAAHTCSEGRKFLVFH